MKTNEEYEKEFHTDMGMTFNIFIQNIKQDTLDAVKAEIIIRLEPMCNYYIDDNNTASDLIESLKLENL